MKMIIKIIFLAIVILKSNFLIGQCQPGQSDPQITGFANIGAVSCIGPGSTVTMQFSWIIGCGASYCNTPPGSWYIAVTFPPNGVYGIQNVSSVTGPQFDWTYYDSEKTLVGFVNTNLFVDNNTFPPTGNASGTVQIVVTGYIGATTCNQPINCSVQCQIIPSGPNACVQAFNDNPSNNYQQNALSVNITLPLAIGNFEVMPRGCDDNQLIWSAYNQKSGEYFVIERKTDDTEFVQIGEVKVTNSFDDYYHYSFKDESILPTVKNYYYRLKHYDLKGNYSFSKIVSARNKCINSLDINIYPNPVKEMLNIAIDELILNEIDEFTVELYDVIGKKHLSKNYTTKDNEKMIQLKLGDEVAAGSYLCRVKSGDVVLKIQNIAVIR